MLTLKLTSLTNELINHISFKNLMLPAPQACINTVDGKEKHFRKNATRTTYNKLSEPNVRVSTFRMQKISIFAGHMIFSVIPVDFTPC